MEMMVLVAVISKQLSVGGSLGGGDNNIFFLLFFTSSASPLDLVNKSI